MNRLLRACSIITLNVGACAQAVVNQQLAATASPSHLANSDWEGVRAAFDTARHRVFAVAGGHRARNPGQHWTLGFDGRGVSAEADAGSWTWGLELASYGWGSDEHAVSGPRTVKADGGRVEYEWDDRLTEWYVNDSRGLEHGYTVHGRPAARDDGLALTLTIRGAFAAQVSADGRNVIFTHESRPTVLTYSGLAVFDADGRSLAATWQTLGRCLRLHVDDEHARYPLTIDPILQQDYLKASNTDPNDQFGYAVAASDNTVVIGAWGEQSNATGVNGNQGDNSMVAAGAAYVFVRHGTLWTQQAYLKASNTQAHDQFGFAVAISGDTIVVSARLESSAATTVNGNQSDNSAPQAGAAYVFVRNGTVWTQQAYLKAANAEAGDLFGQSVAVSGNTVVVGAMWEASSATGVNGNAGNNSMSGAGAAYVYERNGSAWSQQAYLKASNTDWGDVFGRTVAIDGDTILVGAPSEDSDNANPANNTNRDSGAAYVFSRSGPTWTQQAILKGSNPGAWLGHSVAVSGDRAVVGMPYQIHSPYSPLGPTTGGAQVFVRNGSSWSQQALLVANHQGAGDEFGFSVSISSGTILVGAYREDSIATGVNGNVVDDSSLDSGAAYVFIYSAGGWSQAAYLKASNNGWEDHLGFAVAVSGNTIVVGARNEDSNATGVNGDQASAAAGDSGAAYVFDQRDECGGALPLVLGLNSVVNSAATTTSAPPMSCSSAGKDSWFSYTATHTVPHTFDTCSAATNFNTVLELYSGSCGALTSLACNDDACGQSASVTASLTQGATYLLRLGGFANATGSATIRVATGTGTGTIVPTTTASQCPSAATLMVAGNPNIGGTITMTVNGYTGFPLTAYGFLPNLPLPLPCGCAVVSGVAGPPGELFFGPTIVLTMPNAVSLIGVQAELQGLDVFPTSGGCTFLDIPFGATDIATITIG